MNLFLYEKFFTLSRKIGTRSEKRDRRSKIGFVPIKSGRMVTTSCQSSGNWLYYFFVPQSENVGQPLHWVMESHS